jgi:aspartokinase-like uncharacterized kinase
MQTSEQFLSMLSEFSRSVGLPDQAGTHGLEFTAGDYTVVVLQHPARQDLLVAEVTVDEIDAGSSAAPVLLRALHLLNETARFEHDWQVTVSTEDVILLYAIRSIGQTGAADLEALLCDGIERAEALREVIAGLRQGGGEDAQARPADHLPDGDASAGGFSPGMLRA